MSNSSRVYRAREALNLLQLASEIPADSFPALKDAATSAISIVDAITDFTSNRQDWERCAQYTGNAVGSAVWCLGVQDPPEGDVREKMGDLLEVLENIKAKIHRLQQVRPNWLNRVWYLLKGHQLIIADIKTRLNAVLVLFGPLPDAGVEYPGMEPNQLLASVMERYGASLAVEHPSIRGTVSMANRNTSTSNSTDELPTLSAIVAIPVVEHPLNCSIASVAPRSDDANQSAMAQAAVCQSPIKTTYLTSNNVFNTVGTSGTVNNVAGDYVTYGPSDEQLVLDKLACAEGASWDPKLVCLPGTRAKMLSVIHAWSRSFGAQNLFWLNAVAGAGKSAIAHTIAQALRSDGLLASSFFFDRNDAALHHPIVVVIDALDEAISDDSDTSLLAILRDEASHLPPQLRFLITARPTWIIEQHLSGQDHITSHSIDIHSRDNQHDIAAYVDAQLRDKGMCLKIGPSWPDEALIVELKALAEGLFIWIATICSYLRSAYKPKAKLDALLSKSVPQGLPASKKMDALYASILELCADWEDADFLKDYNLVMGAIMAAKRPLSLIAMKALHGANHPMELSADVLLERFGSVLVGFKTDHEPIRMLHVSFREFVTNNANSTEHTRKFYVSEKVHSGRLSELCLQTIDREFKAGHISGTGYLEWDDDDSPGIPEVTGVSEQLLYSCESWNDHISDVTEPNPVIFEHLRAFLLHHTTVWMEVVSSQSIFLGSLSVFCWSKDHAPEIREQFDDESHASTLLSLSIRLSYAGRLEEAFTAVQEAVDLRRALAAERPAVFNADLADSLNHLSVRLSAVGRTEEALTVVHESVYLRRALVEERPAVFNSDLAESLSNLSVYLSAVGRTEEALTAVQEAVDLRRALAAERPAVFGADLARSLKHLSVGLAAAGRREEALTASQEMVGMRRALAAERPAVFNADLARSLYNLSFDLLDIGQKEEALTAVQEAVDLYRTLAEERPTLYNDHLANSLEKLSIVTSSIV
ncbi:hypothetical protein FIBSPDRAFT_1053011 [Athelia psychrophila]|uniref:Nephrocystin 3-like N-terminal domain-containing protein n=1 Tax=Athelia psychrophila TaxID=1759441 RepID=A0A167XMU5_9AGAM|nr:hypothetical protein FIBSPDRAFT_1053011 [Fibularhizoctonia sp. CBS 109695]